MTTTPILEYARKVAYIPYEGQKVDDPESSNAKRRKIDEESMTLRESVIRAIAGYIVGVYTRYELPVANLEVSELVSGALKTTFNARKKQNNGNRTFLEKMQDKDIQIDRNKVMPMRVSLNILDNVLEVNGLKWSDGSRTKEWVGHCVPIMVFLYGFKLRVSELRTGHHQYKHKTSNAVVTEKVSTMGLFERHHIFLEGCTWAPDVQSSMSQSLGPLTLVLKAADASRSDMFTDKIENGIMRAYGHFAKIAPHVLNVMMTSTKAQKASICTAMGELSIVAPPRNQRRIFVPSIWFALFVLSESEVVEYSYESREDATTKAQVWVLSTPMAGLNNKSNIKHLDYSGKGAFQVYDQMRRQVWTYPSKTKDPQGASEVVFHSYWGTFCEDLGILKTVTGCDFKTRKELGAFFREKGTTTERVLLSLPPMRFYSKTVSGNVSQIGSGKGGQICANPIFTGKRKVKRSEEFFKQMTQEPGAAIMDANTLVNEILMEVRKVITDQQRKPVFEMGTTNWFQVKEKRHKDYVEIGPTADFVAEESGKFFLS
uniref:Nucleocapsid protein n=1 Tax=Insect orthomyxo-like virus 1 TaxID=2819085 RepID=A0A7H0RPG9_9ORTO|nr:nucleocapsid protein [Insect orthomyxo-like virus 1]